MATDPVCGMFVDESPEALRATVRGTTYYFCSEGCMRTFVSPEVELKRLRLMVVLSAALAVPTLLLTYFPPSLHFPLPWLLLFLATPVQFVAGWRFYQGAWDGLRLRMSNMDLLVALGTSAAYFYSLTYVLVPSSFPNGGLFFDASTMIIALILIGKLLEHSVRQRASDAIRKLVDLQPRTATLLTGSGEAVVPVERLEAGQTFLVRPGERIATDGIVVEGHSSVDEKLLTGESIPKEKSPGDGATGGSLNGAGSLTIRATKVGMDTTLSKIVQIVQKAQSTRSPVERLADRISTYFVPIVVATAIVSFTSWTLIGGKTTSFALTAAISVLVIACPCALGLATPAAIAVGAGKGAENGILIKGGDYLQKAQDIDTVVFDKTGTLTKGEPAVTDVIPAGEGTVLSPDDILLKCAIAEKHSEHPLASAVLAAAGRTKRGGQVPDPTAFTSIPGRGVRASYGGEEFLLGTTNMLEANGIPITAETKATLARLYAEGKTSMTLAINGVAAGIIAVADSPRESAKQTIAALHRMGIEVFMLTGDAWMTAKSTADRLGIDRCFAEVLPGEKSDLVKRLQSEGRIVAMVGDGINDAPAIAQSDVGIVMGSGADIAVETGGLILMKDDLRDVVTGIQLSRRVMTKVKENLVWAFVYNVALIPIAAGLLFLIAGILLNPILSGAAMAMSSVTVVTNSLTLRRFKPKF